MAICHGTTCYFLLNYAGCTLSITGSTLKAWRQDTCYFLLNYASVWLLESPEELGRDLLFSFELCEVEPPTPKEEEAIEKFKTCYFLLNYAWTPRPWTACACRRHTCPWSLAIFFWIMHARWRGDSIPVRVTATCYFLLNYAPMKLESWRSGWRRCYLLFSFELCPLDCF